MVECFMTVTISDAKDGCKDFMKHASLDRGNREDYKVVSG
jgi:hypothetical protein